jgi:uncharacterized membrane protein YfbV (UPF0208 family)
MTDSRRLQTVYSKHMCNTRPILKKYARHFPELRLVEDPAVTRQAVRAVRRMTLCMLETWVVAIGAVVVTAIVYLCWLYRVSTNLPALAVNAQTYSPGWSVGYWFIPFVNLVCPYQAVKEVFEENHPPADVEPPD